MLFVLKLLSIDHSFHYLETIITIIYNSDF